MSDELLQKIAEGIDELLQRVRGGGLPPAGSLVFPGPNGIAIVNGVAMFIDEPIAADWEPSMEARMLTAQGRIGTEPSNAFDSGLAKRSPNGYPLVYGVGQFGPQAPARIKFGGDTFADEADLATFRAALSARVPDKTDFSPRR